MQTVWLPKGYQEDSPEDREGEYVEMMRKSDHDASEIKWMNIVTALKKEPMMRTISYDRGNMAVVFQVIDDAGGWPVGAKSLVMRHGFSPYTCHFSDREDVRDEWNTSLYTADDYYKWKLSDKAKEDLRREGRRQCHDAIGRLGVYRT